jgi:hypothetical protein
MFPGAGTGNAGAPLAGGMICDAVARKAANSATSNAAKPVTECLVAKDGTRAAATLERVLECVAGRDAIRLRLTLDPSFVDNTFGVNSIGWPHKRGHTFDRDLTKSDHAEFIVTDAAGKQVVRFKLDYISPDPKAPSGFGTLGVLGGDGGMVVGDPAWIVKWNTSISRNLNERGYASYTVDSPATDDKYTPNPAAPEWDFRVVYEAWVDLAAFTTGFGGATIEFVHASPAKGGTDTLDVMRGKCPPEWCLPDDPKCPSTLPPTPDAGTCGPDDPKCPGNGGMGGSTGYCGPDDPMCTGSGGIGDDNRATPFCTAFPADPICTPQ